MLGKRGQVTPQALKEAIELLLRGLALLILLGILAAIIGIFNPSNPKENAIKDTDRIVAELLDLRRGETLNVPILSVGYEFVVKTSLQAKKAGIECRPAGDYCACLLKNDAAIYCKGIKLRTEHNNIIGVSLGVIELNPSVGVTMTYSGNSIKLTGGSEYIPPGPPVDPDADYYPGSITDLTKYVSTSTWNAVLNKSNSRGGVTVNLIMLHHTAGDIGVNRVTASLNHWSQDHVSASAHYIVDKNGDVVLVIPESEAAWHGNCINSRSIGIEIVNNGLESPREEYPQVQIDAVANLVHYLVTKYGITEGNIVGHGCSSLAKMDQEPTGFPRDFGTGLKLYTYEAGAKYKCDFLC